MGKPAIKRIQNWLAESGIDLPEGTDSSEVAKLIHSGTRADTAQLKELVGADTVKALGTSFKKTFSTKTESAESEPTGPNPNSDPPPKEPAPPTAKPTKGAKQKPLKVVKPTKEQAPKVEKAPKPTKEQAPKVEKAPKPTKEQAPKVEKAAKPVKEKPVKVFDETPPNRPLTAGFGSRQARILDMLIDKSEGDFDQLDPESTGIKLDDHRLVFHSFLAREGLASVKDAVVLTKTGKRRWGTKCFAGPKAKAALNEYIDNHPEIAAENNLHKREG